jgi:hypothetical protein
MLSYFIIPLICNNYWSLLIFCVIIGNLVLFSLKYLVIVLNKANNENEVQEEENEYQCFVCKNKFVTNKLMSGYDGKHPLCSDECIDKYITSGFKYVGR